MSDDDDDNLFGDDDEEETKERGLFDSDDEDEELDNKNAKKNRLKALASKKRQSRAKAAPVPEKKKKATEKQDGYESEATDDSANFERTKADDDFIDNTGVDDDEIKEFYAKQNFAPTMADDDDDDRKKKRKHRPDEAEEEGAEPSNPIMAAVHRMKKKTRTRKNFTELEDDCKLFLARMEQAFEEDEIAIKDRQPALHKLGMLTEVVDFLTVRDHQRHLLDHELLSICRRWIQPLPSGKLGNVTIRQRLIDVIGKMQGINANDLKRSEFGRTVMTLCKHPDETPEMKTKLRTLVEKWSRPIFQKSGNMRDLERVRRGEQGLASIARQARSSASQPAAMAPEKRDIGNLIATGKKGAESGINRVRVPFSKGFAYSVRPNSKTDTVADARLARSPQNTNTRGHLSKRMLEKGRVVAKNQRSANISIEGRRTKG